MSNLKLFNQQITDVRTQAYLQSVLGEKKNEFVNNCTALVANNVNLQKCEPTTIMFAALKATALDLPLDQNLGFAYVIPYENKKEQKSVAQLQFGYRAYVQLAIRSGQFKKINVTDVRQGELVGRDRRTGEMKFNWIEDEAARLKAPIVGYLGYFRLINGYEKESYWSVDELKEHGMRYSQTFSSKYENVRNQSKWTTDFDMMCRKTVLKLMLNKGDAPLSVQVQQAIKFDQSVIRDENDKPEYIDNNVEEAVAVEVAEAANKTELPEENQPIGKQKQPEIFK